jgi:hypothetical protein
VVSTLMPTRCSDSASAPPTGQNIGAFHHRSVSGRACAFHQRIQVLSAGSAASCGSADAIRVTIAHIVTRVSAV